MTQLLFLLIPLVFVFVLNLPRRGFAAKLAPWVLGFVCLIQMALAPISLTAFWQSFVGSLGGSPAGGSILAALSFLPVSNGMSIDVLSVVVLFLIGLVVAVVNAVGIPGTTRNKVLASSLILVIMAGMNGVVMARDLFSLYIFLEVTAVSAFILIAVRESLAALAGAFKYFILSGLATLAMLVAITLVFMKAGSLGFASVASALGEQDMTVQIALICFTVAFCVKAGLAPFHGWLPDAYASASNAVSVLLAGIVTKVAGVYVIIRLMSDVFAGLHTPSLAFMAFGAFSIVVGAFGAIGQTEMKRMLAFSSISQMGYIVLAAGLATPLALIGALVHFVNHALFKSLLFVNATAVEEQTGTTEFAKLGGLTERLKVTGWTSTIGFLSTAGIPPFSGFWSKLLIIVALSAAGQWFFAALAVLMSLVTLGYFLIMQRKVFFGVLREGFEELREARGALVGTSLFLTGLTTGLGLLFPLVLVGLYNIGLLG